VFELSDIGEFGRLMSDIE